MLDQEDKFYTELPFTLTPQQSHPEYIIFGTGLQQCLLAAHLSKMHMKPGLILDMDRTYGSCLKTVTIRELIALAKGKARVPMYEFMQLEEFVEGNGRFEAEVEKGKGHRGYSVDLEPCFFFGASVTCDMLKQADMDKYMDFRLVYSMLHYEADTFKHVPLSKGKIFESKDLGLLEKKLLLSTFHSLVQIYNKYMQVAEDQNSTKQFDKQFGQVDEKLYAQFLAGKDQPFLPFISKITKNNHKIMNYIIYILCNYPYSHKVAVPQHAQPSYTLGEFIQRFGKFVKSCGIYGQGPYLYVDNGIGDVPQAFSRIASIYLSTYILHPMIRVDKIEQTETGTLHVHTNLHPGSPITTQHIYYGPTSYGLKFPSDADYDKQYTLRIILLCRKLGTQEQCPALVYLLDLKQYHNPVYMFMFDHNSHTCPEGMVVYQFESVVGSGEQQGNRARVREVLEVMARVRGEGFRASVQLATAYVREKRYPRGQVQGGSETVLRDHAGIDLDGHFEGFREVVGQQGAYFRKEKQPGQQEEEWQGNETLDLIERLDAIDLSKKQEQPQQESTPQPQINEPEPQNPQQSVIPETSSAQPSHPD